MTALGTVRAVRDAAEIARVDSVRESAGFGAMIVEEMRWVRFIGAGQVFLAEEDGVPVGAGAALSFGSTGWIGGVCVIPEARRRGLGGALTSAAATWLRERGARTVLLYATDLGRPVYERLGFVPDGSAELFSGIAPAGAEPRGAVRAATPEDLDSALVLDRLATGEDRREATRGLWPARAFVHPGEPDLRGAAIGARFTGGAVVARDEEAGRALLRTSIAAQVGEIRAAVPSANAPAREELHRAGFRHELSTPRMRLGPPVAARPDLLYRLFNLFWG